MKTRLLRSDIFKLTPELKAKFAMMDDPKAAMTKHWIISLDPAFRGGLLQELHNDKTFEKRYPEDVIKERKKWKARLACEVGYRSGKQLLVMMSFRTPLHIESLSEIKTIGHEHWEKNWMVGHFLTQTNSTKTINCDKKDV